MACLLRAHYHSECGQESFDSWMRRLKSGHNKRTYSRVLYTVRYTTKLFSPKGSPRVTVPPLHTPQHVLPER